MNLKDQTHVIEDPAEIKTVADCQTYSRTISPSNLYSQFVGKLEQHEMSKAVT
jgi:hypothetical protein